MTLQEPVPVANGIRTDHPVPGLPFVEDAGLPLDDPDGIAAIGRNVGEGRWGRTDVHRLAGGWTAFTTDAVRTDLGWVVRWHPDYGRSVLLYEDDDATTAYTRLNESPGLLMRSGGYEWHGTSWTRPAQIWDRASERWLRRPVPAAMTVSAADLLETGGNAGRAELLQVVDVDVAMPLPSRWLDHLALWSSYRRRGLHPSACVVNVTAPELAAGNLVGAVELAEIAGIAPSTLRAYLTRAEGSVPDPQAVVGGRAVWSRPVAEEWAESRRRSSDGLTESVSRNVNGQDMPSGVIDILERFTRVCTMVLWDNPDRRRRWALRFRNQKAVAETSELLGWYLASEITAGKVLDLGNLSYVVKHAVWDEIAEQQRSERSMGDTEEAAVYTIQEQTSTTLDWLVRIDPDRAAQTIADILYEAQRRFGISRPTLEWSIRCALDDGKMSEEERTEYLDRVFNTEKDDD